MGAIFNVVVALIGIHFFGYTFCRYGIAGDEKYMRFALREHWRIWTTGLVGWVIAAIAVYLAFPYSRLSLQISLAGALGCFPGILLGCGWYVISKRRILKVRFKGIVGLVFGTAIGVGVCTFLAIPLFQKQQKELLVVQSFSKRDILQVDVDFQGLKRASITNLDDLNAIKSLFADAEIYYEELKSDMPTVQIKIQSRDNTFEYEGFTVAGNEDDVILKIPKLGKLLGDKYGIRLPGLKRWLDDNVLKKQK
ncbi:MAG: hypothetical protein PHQ35_02050 [Phycisphaerae bacterium]|nr:hypothetical protein [Phycisphaerae bacterium]MDD5380427.1 hypothetical protein [Phycisphaerae bacterium]